jgi:DNA-binding HxlR family transcriptional regulator
MEILGKRWTGLIVNVLLEGPKRFSALATRLELVSERMLSERLKELELHGIVQRQVLPDSPIRVQYDLTAKGRALSGVVSAIENWASQWVSVPEGCEPVDGEHAPLDEAHPTAARLSSS